MLGSDERYTFARLPASDAPSAAARPKGRTAIRVLVVVPEGSGLRTRYEIQNLQALAARLPGQLGHRGLDRGCEPAALGAHVGAIAARGRGLLGELCELRPPELVERQPGRDRQDPGRQRGRARQIEPGQRAQHPDERLLHQILDAMRPAPGEQAPDHRVHRGLVALDQRPPRRLVAALRATQRQLIEWLGGASGSGHVDRYHPAGPQKFRSIAEFLQPPS